MAAIVEEQKQITQILAHDILQKRVSHAYLFAGVDQLQTTALGYWFCQALFCPYAHAGYPCLKCNNCRRIQKGDFPDVSVLQTSKQNLGIDEIRDFKLTLGQTGLENNHRVFLIKGAEKLTLAAENSLLKLLEEPEGDLTIILLAASSSSLLPTVLSRVQIINLPASRDQDLLQRLQQQGYALPDIDLIQKVHLEDQVITDLSANQFSKIKTQVQSWFHLLLDNPLQAFVAVTASILPIIENRSQQEIFWNLLEWYFSQNLSEQTGSTSALMKSRQLGEQFLHAQKLWSANVSFENSLEQLALAADSISKGS